MILFMLAIKDRAVDAFGRPIFFPAVGAAVRAFQDEMNRVAPDNTMNAHPDDYDLYLLGTFEDATGHFEVEAIPKQVAIGKQLKV